MEKSKTNHIRKSKPDPVIENELFDDENLLWWGRPKPIHLIHLSDIPSALFGVLFTGFAVFFISASSSMRFSRMPGNFGAFELLFIIIPIGFMGVGLWHATHPLRKYYSGMHTFYALTNQRAIIITGGLSSGVRSFYSRDIDRVQRTNHRDGTGSVIFTTEQVTQYRHSNNGGSRPYTATIKHGFWGIEDARYVEDVIVQTFIQPEEGEGKRKNSDFDS